VNAALVCLFILGAFIELVGIATIAGGADQRHWGAVGVFIGAVLCVTAAVLMDGLT